MATIQFRTPNASGTRDFDSEITVGRAADCDLVLDSPDVSRRHGTLSHRDGAIYFTDLGSANGSRLNGARVQPNVATPVAAGDTLALGNCTLTLTEEAASASASLLPSTEPTGESRSSPASVPAEPAPARGAQAAPRPAAPTSQYVPVPRDGGGRRSRLNRPLAGTLTAVVGLAFLAFVGSHTVNSVILDPDYYISALEDGDIFEKAFTDLLADPSLGDQIGDFFGGVDVAPGDRVSTAKKIAPPDKLKSSVRQTAGKTTKFFEDKQGLDLGLNITPFLDLIDDGASGYTADQLVNLPTKRSANYTAFRSELQAAIDQIRTTGKLPAALPVFDIPADRRDEVRDLIITGAGIGASTPNAQFITTAVRVAIASNDVESAMKAALAPMLANVTSNATKSLVDSDFIRPGAGGDFFLAPSLDALTEIDSGFSDFQTVVKISRVAEPVSLVVLCLALAGMFLLGWPDWLRAARWAGLALVAAGAVGIVGWFAGRGPLKDYITGIALEDPGGLPGSFRGLVEAGIGAAVDNLTSSVVTPCAIAVVVGIVLFGVAAVLERREGRLPVADPEAAVLG